VSGTAPPATAEDWFRRAVAAMPGGVNSPVRAFGAVGDTPVFAARATGAVLTGHDEERLIDFIASWGALLFGHANEEIVEAVASAARTGTSFGVPTTLEVELAELIVSLVPSVEVVRMVNSGTEATASAIRVARAATSRPGIVKFEGCYHGHADPFLVKAGSGAATLSEPDSPGVPPATVADTRIARFNDLESVERCLAAGDIAAVIVEPVAGNMGVVPPGPRFLEGLRQRCEAHDALLIFDEVMTGFRVARGGAQERYGITPDLTTLGKIVAGGTAAAAYGGRADLMSLVAPSGPVYQAGTLAGNPIAAAAGLACLRMIARQDDLYDRIEEIGATLEAGITDAMQRHGIAGCVQRVGGMLTAFFGPEAVTSWDDAVAVDRDRFAAFFRAARRRGVLVPPSQFEALFVMEAHGDVLDEAVAALAGAIGDVA
jgi:glutamate-1-semialdehyde 2,1-aminomutase